MIIFYNQGVLSADTLFCKETKSYFPYDFLRNEPKSLPLFT